MEASMSKPVRYDPATGETWMTYQRWWNGPIVRFGEPLSGAADKMCREVREEKRVKKEAA